MPVPGEAQSGGKQTFSDPWFAGGYNDRVMANPAHAGAIATSYQQNLSTVLGNRQQKDSLLRQGTLTGSQYDLQRKGLTAEAQQALAKLGLGGQGDSIKMAALLRQLGLSGQMEGNEMATLGLGYRGLEGDWRTLTQQEMEARRDTGRAKTEFGGQTAASGAIGTAGYGRGLTKIADQLNDQLFRIKEARTDIGLKRKHLDLQGGRMKLTYGEQRADLKDQMKLLGLLGKERGLDEKGVREQLNRGLEQMGLSQAMDEQQLLDAVYSNDLKEAQIAEQILRQAMGPVSQGFGAK